jgi:PAS domain S-box-containing protein
MHQTKLKVAKRTILISISILIIWSGIVVYNLKEEQDNAIANLTFQNEIEDSNTEFLVDKYIEEIIENLKIIRDADEFQQYLDNPSDESMTEVQLMFQRVMGNKGDYDQLRLINADGYEVIRVDNEGDEGFVLFDEADLQDKSDRYYFEKTVQIAYDEVFISPLDLNIENGVVEIPYKPVVRFSTPIYNNENEFMGILIINYNAEYFVNILEEHHGHSGIENFWFYVINRNGQFILHQDENNNFSFMFEESETVNFSQISETAWESIIKNNSGELLDSNNLITYYDLLTTTRTSNQSYEDRWITVHVMDISTLFSFKAFIKEMTLLRNIIIILLILLFSFLYSYISEKSRKKDDKLEITEMIAGSTNDGVMITDINTDITYVNRAFEEITGYTATEVMGRQPRDYKSGKQDDAFYQRMWQSINTEGYWQGMIWDKKKNGVLYLQKMKIIAVNDKYNRVHHYINIFSDASMQKNRVEKLKDIGRKDGNFFVPNEDMMLQLLKQSVKDEKFRFMVLYVSIENYNQLMTTFLDFESRCTELFIDSINKIIDEDDFIAQTGRNIFAIIVNVKKIDVKPELFANKIHKGLSRTIEVDGKELFFKTRMGISFWPNKTKDLKNLLLNSIIALEWSSSRQAKEIVIFEEEMIQALNKENEIEGHLRNAIAKNELYMVYQPQVDSRTNKVVGVESLIRWHNDKLGNISPGVFIPIAERSNLIIEIGYWIINRVCEDLAEIYKGIPEKYRDIRCAINLSAVQIQEGIFLEKLFNIIDDSEVSYSNLEIEITESLLLSNQMKSVEILKSMQSEGLKIAIDDFGTGYSSLSYLNTLPFDKIKIDRSFIKDYPEKDDGKLAKILVNMAESLNKDVLTEGAETLEQVEFLQHIGCMKIQGYYYSKPLDKADFIDYLMHK